MTRTPAAVIRLNAGNDRNGNPRRVFAGVARNGDFLGVYDEGYSGKGAMPKAWQQKYSGLSFDTTPKEYRDLIRNYNEA